METVGQRIAKWVWLIQYGIVVLVTFMLWKSDTAEPAYSYIVVSRF